jgi:hypothetical protein
MHDGILVLVCDVDSSLGNTPFYFLRVSNHRLSNLQAIQAIVQEQCTLEQARFAISR